MNTRIHGHRGARGRRPENTLAAVEYALRQGADGVEVDVCVTRDDQIVLHHDLWLNPATTRDARGQWLTNRTPIRKLTLDELRQTDVGRLKPHSKYAAKFTEQIPVDGARIPTLEELVECVRRHDHRAQRSTVFNLEMKSGMKEPGLAPEPECYASLLANKLEELGLEKNVFLQSFDWRLMRVMEKQRRPGWKIGFTKQKPKHRPFNPADLEAVKNNRGDVFSCKHTGLTESLPRQAHDLGLEVYVWTVNRERDMEKYAKWDVDVIITDYPERCHMLLNAGIAQNGGKR